MQDPVAEIKSRLMIEDVVGPYVQLKKAGKYFKGRCPFHDEKTPSFFVSPDRQIAYCFSCQKGGDMFNFIQEIEGMDFAEALELLAEKAGVDLSKSKRSKAPKVSKDEKSQIKEVFKDSAKFFADQVFCSSEEEASDEDSGENKTEATETESSGKTDSKKSAQENPKDLARRHAGEKVFQYLKGRGVEAAIIKEFQVGFAPASRDALYRHLLEKKHPKQTLLQSTMVVSKDSESRVVNDRFQLRLMFPIDNPQGDTIAFGGRALKKGDQPKYLNSPEHLLYHKSNVLYNLSRAKPAIRELDFVVIVEGYFDAMLSYQAGVKNTVASCGTALTEKQFKLLKRYTQNIVFALDSDSAGQAALLRGIEVAQELELKMFVVDFSAKHKEAKDAADLVKEDPEAWQEAVANRVPYLAYFLDKWEKMFDLNSPDEKQAYSDAFMGLLKGVKHPVEEDHYLKELALKIGMPVDRLQPYLAQLRAQERKFKGGGSSGFKGQNRQADQGGYGSGAGAESAEQKAFRRRKRLMRYFLGLVAAYPKQYFKRFLEWENPDFFLEKVQSLDLVKPLYKLEAEAFALFYRDFDSHLEKSLDTIDASHVYKQIRDQYNQHEKLDPAFYTSFSEGPQLQNWALEAEVRIRDTQSEEEFDKLMTLLYLELNP
jgi:DNA primase